MKATPRIQKKKSRKKFLVLFVQFMKCKKHTQSSVTFGIAGFSLQIY